MDRQSRRGCPLCGGSAGKPTFPYATRFNNIAFDYLKCRSCAGVFVDPVPDAGTFAKMYAKASYHDAHYTDIDGGHYEASAKLLAEFLPKGACVLDYGCGLGLFLKALQAEGFLAAGVEFNQEAADHAAQNAQRPAFSVATFWLQENNSIYDAIHFGDVLEHLPDPASTLRQVLRVVKPGGLLFVEGPLENNPSPVFLAARLFGAVKRIVRPNFIGSSPPTHLLRVNAAQQLAFLTRLDPGLSRLHWDVYETGWPYEGAGLVKRVIARAAALLGGREVLGVTFGNRFRGLFRLPDAVRP